MSGIYIDKWPVIREFLRREFDNLGYLKLSTYNTSKGKSEHLSRFKMDDETVEFWLDQTVADLADDPDGGAMDSMLQRPTLGTGDEINDPLDVDLDAENAEFDDEEMVSPSDRPEAQPPPKSAAAKALEAEDARDNDGEAPEDEAEDESDIPEEGEEDDAAEQEQIKSEAIEAIRRWLHMTIDHNTPSGGSAAFRIFFMAPKGSKHLWSTTVDYRSHRARLAPQHDPDFDPTSKGAVADLLAAAPAQAQPATLASQVPAVAPHEQPPAPKPAKKDNGVDQVETVRIPRGIKGTSEEQAVQTLMTMHSAMRTIIATNVNSTQQMMRMQNNFLRSMNRAYQQEREQNAELWESNLDHRVTEAEMERNAAHKVTKEGVRQTLGQAAIEQGGSVLKALLAAKLGNPMMLQEAAGGLANAAAGALGGMDGGQGQEPANGGGADGFGGLTGLMANPDMLKALQDPDVQNALQAMSYEDLKDVAQMINAEQKSQVDAEVARIKAAQEASQESVIPQAVHEAPVDEPTTVATDQDDYNENTDTPATQPAIDPADASDEGDDDE